jgi:integrase
MGRPRLGVGAHGNTRIRKAPDGRWVAATYVRDGDGRRREVRREAATKSGAQQALQQALGQRAGLATADITADSRMGDVAEAWLAHIQRQVDHGALAPNTGRLYRSVWDKHVRGAVESLRVREATVSRLDAFIVSLRAHAGASLTKTARTVLSGVLGHALRNGALVANPMRDVSRIPSGRRKAPRAMSRAERVRWLGLMDGDEAAVRHDIPDLTRFMLGTGLRIGECLACTFDDVSLIEGVLTVDWNVVRVKGCGLQRMRTKTAAGERTLRLPPSAVQLVERRLAEFGDGPIFPDVKGGWRDPSNTSRCFREARDRAGFDWVTSHTMRKTVATVLDEAGLSAREIADQLGHSRVSMTQDHYMGRRAVGERAAAALELVDGPAVSAE